MTDEVGKQGIEKEFESFLKGTDGYTSLAQTPNGFEVQPDSGRDPVPGNYVVLTLDAKLQAVLEQSLGETIEAIRSAAARLRQNQAATRTAAPRS